MPYRRLPNTDSARLRAMKQAYAMGVELHPNELAYTQDTYTRLGLFINSFQLALHRYREAYQQQSESSGEYQVLLRRAKLYVSHFIQVVNMAVLRGELKAETRGFFGLELDVNRVPSLASDADVVEWGRKIIDGEFARTSTGLPPIANPTIALVRVHYEIFLDAYNRQKVFQQNTSRCLAELNELRVTADTIILSIWNEVEAHFASLPPSEARGQAKAYGLVYVFRRNEVADASRSDDALGRAAAEAYNLFNGQNS